MDSLHRRTLKSVAHDPHHQFQKAAENNLGATCYAMYALELVLDPVFECMVDDGHVLPEGCGPVKAPSFDRIGDAEDEIRLAQTSSLRPKDLAKEVKKK